MLEVEVMNEQSVHALKISQAVEPANTTTNIQHNGPHQLHGLPQMRVVENCSRRRYLQLVIASFGALGLWFMDLAAKRSSLTPENRETTVTVPWNAAHGIHFFDQFVVINNASGVAVLSSHCTHLGCRINRTEGSELVCPCHGSRFNLNGEPSQGPARERLRELPFTLDQTNALIRVSVER